jgi:hypothetical protein
MKQDTLTNRHQWHLVQYAISPRSLNVHLYQPLFIRTRCRLAICLPALRIPLLTVACIGDGIAVGMRRESNLDLICRIELELFYKVEVIGMKVRAVFFEVFSFFTRQSKI